MAPHAGVDDPSWPVLGAWTLCKQRSELPISRSHIVPLPALLGRLEILRQVDMDDVDFILVPIGKWQAPRSCSCCSYLHSCRRAPARNMPGHRVAVRGCTLHQQPQPLHHSPGNLLPPPHTTQRTTAPILASRRWRRHDRGHCRGG